MDADKIMSKIKTTSWIRQHKRIKKAMRYVPKYCKLTHIYALLRLGWVVLECIEGCILNLDSTSIRNIILLLAHFISNVTN